MQRIAGAYKKTDLGFRGVVVAYQDKKRLWSYEIECNRQTIDEALMDTRAEIEHINARYKGLTNDTQPIR